MKDPDLALVKKAQQGDKHAFGELVNRYYEMVYALSYGVLRNRENARDAAQNVFLKVYNEIGKFEGRSKFKTWLYRIAMNAAIDEGRKKTPDYSLDSPARPGDEDSRPMDLESHAPGPRSEASQTELQEAFKRALAVMTPEHRAILVMREWQGLSYEEIAEALDISSGTVMSRLFYARKKLAEVIGMRREEFQA